MTTQHNASRLPGRARLFELWENLRDSYWFVPTMMATVAVLLAFLLLEADHRLANQGQGESLGWLYGGSAEGARELLSTIAGSMITVTGVVFSVTVVALTLAASQFGPRLLYNFIRDRANQIVLGTFVATFLYCILVLLNVRGGDEDGFVPQLAISVSVLFAIADIGVLIYFIHHLITSLQVTSIIDRVAHELHDHLEQLYPTDIGHAPDEAPITSDSNQALQWREGRPLLVLSDDEGYITHVDGDYLLALAAEKDLLLELKKQPGGFVREGTILCLVWPESIGEEIEEELRQGFAVQERRTPVQDASFLINQLVEIAVRALSPALNDPLTAIACVDRLGAALCQMARQERPPGQRYDDQGRLRLLNEGLTFEVALDGAFSMIRRHAQREVAVSLRMLHVLEEIATCVQREADRQAVLQHATMVWRSVSQDNEEPVDQEQIDLYYRRVLQMLQEEEDGALKRALERPTRTAPLGR